MPWIGPALSVAGSLIGADSSADAASQAAGIQAESGREAIAEQRRQYDLTRSDMAPWRDAGASSVSRLRQLLGLGSGPASPGASGGSGASLDSIAQGLRSSGKYGTGKTWVPGQFESESEYMGKLYSHGTGPNRIINSESGYWKDGNYDEAGLMAEAQRIFDASQASSAPATASGTDAYQMYGDAPLLRRFSGTDLQLDPVYQSGLKFGLDEGTKGINARAMQSGGYDSGATLKALTRFGNDYGSTKANESYNRFNSDQNKVFNMLSGLSGTGQTAANTVASTGANTSNNTANLMTGIGNAQAAGVVGGANAWGNAASGISGAVNNYQNNQLLQKILGGSNAGSYSTPGYGGYDYSNWYG